ncbi:DASS family sodium-coupled anion symporter [Thermoleophilia bacterium SCSIO 60948]|nr:DASS family sodium-coupled anion symporter [Thermoleophilia bacterium SCSIO 60948]
MGVEERPPATAGGGGEDAEKELLGTGTYRSLGEQKLSPQEERFERARRTSGLFIAPAVIIGFLLLPLDLDQTQHTLAAILLGVVALWITEAVPIPVGGLIGIALIVFLGVGDADTVLAPFGSSTVFTFIGAFIIAQAMLRHGLARRFAFRMLAIQGVSKSTARTVIAFGLITAVLSAFVSNTATVAMLLPTAIAILATLTNLMNKERTGDGERFDPLKLRVGVALMLMLAYGASVGGLLTPVGSPPNLIGRQAIENATGERISFFEWMLSALPVCAVMFVILAVILLLLNRPEVKRLEGVDEYVAEERRKLGSMSQKEKNTLIAFATAVTLWIAPGIVGIIAGDDSKAYDEVVTHLDEGIVAIFAASLLFLLPSNWQKREFTLTWSEAKEIDWGTIVLFGSGVIFGTLLAETGLADTLGTSGAEALGVSSTISITIFAVILSILVSETTSNTASASIIIPIVIPVAAAAGVDPFIPALAGTFACSFGFMLPVSTPQNAIVYGSGVVPITKMIKNGFVFDVLGAIAIIVLLPIMVNLLGLAG